MQAARISRQRGQLVERFDTFDHHGKGAADTIKRGYKEFKVEK